MGLSCQAQGFHSSVAVKCSPTPTRMLMLPVDLQCRSMRCNLVLCDELWGTLSYYMITSLWQLAGII